MFCDIVTLKLYREKSIPFQMFCFYHYKLLDFWVALPGAKQGNVFCPTAPEQNGVASGPVLHPGQAVPSYKNLLLRLQTKRSVPSVPLGGRGKPAPTIRGRTGSSTPTGFHPKHLPPVRLYKNQFTPLGTRLFFIPPFEKKGVGEVFVPWGPVPPTRP